MRNETKKKRWASIEPVAVMKSKNPEEFSRHDNDGCIGAQYNGWCGKFVTHLPALITGVIWFYWAAKGSKDSERHKCCEGQLWHG